MIANYKDTQQIFLWKQPWQFDSMSSQCEIGRKTIWLAHDMELETEGYNCNLINNGILFNRHARLKLIWTIHVFVYH